LSAGSYSYKTDYGFQIVGKGDVSNVVTGLNPGTNGQIQLTGLALDPSNTTTFRRIYRTLANGSIYYELATLSDNTTTSYLDNVPDSSISGGTVYGLIDRYTTSVYLCDASDNRRGYHLTVDDKTRMAYLGGVHDAGIYDSQTFYIDVDANAGTFSIGFENVFTGFMAYNVADSVFTAAIDALSTVIAAGGVTW